MDGDQLARLFRRRCELTWCWRRGCGRSCAMDYSTLRVIHITGIVMTFIGLTGILALKMAGGAPLSKRMIFHFSHGIGLLVVIGTGFALAGKLGVTGEPWVAGKGVIWV